MIIKDKQKRKKFSMLAPCLFENKTDKRISSIAPHPILEIHFYPTFQKVNKLTKRWREKAKFHQKLSRKLETKQLGFHKKSNPNWHHF